jgi:hypothetical protein
VLPLNGLNFKIINALSFSCALCYSCEPGDLYFQSEKLRKWSGATPRSISNFERIKVVGKGKEFGQLAKVIVLAEHCVFICLNTGPLNINRHY